MGGVLADPKWDTGRGFRLRQARLRRGLRQKDAGARIGVSPTTVWRWEQGQPMTRAHLRHAARAYRVSQRWLLHGPDVDLREMQQRVIRLEGMVTVLARRIAALQRDGREPAALTTARAAARS